MHTETCKKRITKPGKQVLLPVIFYLDGATTGQFSALSIEALKFSLGVFAHKARQKDHMWRILGCIPQVAQHKSRGRHVAIDSNHVGSVKPCRCTQHCVLPIRVGDHPPKRILDIVMKTTSGSREFCHEHIIHDGIQKFPQILFAHAFASREAGEKISISN